MKTSKLVWIFGIIILIINLYFYKFQPGGEKILKIISDLLPIVCSIIAVIGLLSAVRSFKTLDTAKKSWLFLLIGTILFFIAESTYAYLELIVKIDPEEVFPNIADLIWVIGYIPLIIGLLLLISGYKKAGLPVADFKKYILTGILFIIFLGSLIYLLLIPIVQDQETPILQKIVSLYYPLGDLFLIIPALILTLITWTFGKALLSRPWRFIALGFVLMSISDIFYSYLSWQELYNPGNYIDLGWNASYLLLGLSGIYQKELIQSI